MPPETPYEQLAQENVLLQAEVLDLKKKIAALEAENTALRDENRQLNETIAKLQQRMDDIEHASFRQAAPFRIREKLRKKDPKRPGRKKGHEASYRPVPNQIDEHIVVPLDKCPKCGGVVKDVREHHQYIEDIPPIRIRVTKITTYSGKCSCCGKVRSQNPLQVSTATGAAGTHIGPNALGIAADLRYTLGLTMRKTCTALRLMGLKLTPGGLAQILQRMAGKLKPAYDGLMQAVRGSPVIHADETSWWVGGPGYWLWVFSNGQLTLYRVKSGRGSQVVSETLGDYGGVLVSDCLASYNLIDCRKQKCYAHHLKAVKEALLDRPESKVLADIKGMLKFALSLQPLQPIGEDVLTRLKHWSDRLLLQTYADPVEERIANRLRKQREHLFTFLAVQGVDATNNQAERDLRPAVIARKLSCGNKTEQGKTAWEILASLAATCDKRSILLREYVAGAMTIAAKPSLL